MLFDWMPSFCSRLKIFLSYSSEYSKLADQIAQTLKNEGHLVFFDKDSLPPAGDFNERIRKAINSSDCFLFIASESALEKGKFTLTELKFAKEKWPSPVGHVFPIVIDSNLKPESLPPYLSSVQAVSIAGNATAEIAAAVDKVKKIRSVCLASFAISVFALVGVLGLATGVIPVPSQPDKKNADITTSDRPKNDELKKFQAKQFDGRVGKIFVKNTSLYEFKVTLWHPDSEDIFQSWIIPGTSKRYLKLNNEAINIGSDWGIQIGDSDIKSVDDIADWKNNEWRVSQNTFFR